MENTLTKKYNKKYNYAYDGQEGQIKQIVHLSPTYQIKNISYDDFLDVYYDTNDNFLENLDATIRLRQRKNSWTLSVRHREIQKLQEEKSYKVYKKDIPLKHKFLRDENCLFFLEDKIRQSFTHRLDIDVVRNLKNLKPNLAIKTEREIYEIIDNKDFNMQIYFDYITFQTRNHMDYDKVVKFKLTCFPSSEHLMHFNKILNEIRRKINLIEVVESRYDTGHRMLHWAIRAEDYDFQDEEDEEDEEEDEKE